MNCKQFAKYITDYVDGSIDRDVAGGVEMHLSTCAGCAKLVRELAYTSSLVRSLDREPAPEGFERRLKARMAAQRHNAAHRSVWSRLVHSLTEAFASIRVRRIALKPAVAAFLLCAIVVGSAFMLVRGTYFGPPDMDWEYIETCQEQHASFASANPLADDSAIILKERARALEDQL